MCALGAVCLPVTQYTPTRTRLDSSRQAQAQSRSSGKAGHTMQTRHEPGLSTAAGQDDRAEEPVLAKQTLSLLVFHSCLVLSFLSARLVAYMMDRVGFGGQRWKRLPLSYGEHRRTKTREAITHQHSGQSLACVVPWSSSSPLQRGPRRTGVLSRPGAECLRHTFRVLLSFSDFDSKVVSCKPFHWHLPTTTMNQANPRSFSDIFLRLPNTHSQP